MLVKVPNEERRSHTRHAKRQADQEHSPEAQGIGHPRRQRDRRVDRRRHAGHILERRRRPGLGGGDRGGDGRLRQPGQLRGGAHLGGDVDAVPVREHGRVDGRGDGARGAAARRLEPGREPDVARRAGEGHHDERQQLDVADAEPGQRHERDYNIWISYCLLWMK